MNMNRFCVKFFARPGGAVDEVIFIDIFHQWIRQQKIDGLLLDVADYRHVPEGPGIMLITHEINFAMDNYGGRFGLLAQRKRGRLENHRDRIVELVRRTLAFGALLESDWRIKGKLSLEGGRFHYIANDRLLAPHTATAYTDLLPDLKAAAAIIYPGREVAISRLENDPRERLTAIVDAGSVGMSQFLETVAAVA